MRYAQARLDLLRVKEFPTMARGSATVSHNRDKNTHNRDAQEAVPPERDMSSLNKRLAAAIGLRSMAAVAREADVPTQTLHNWVKGKGQPSGEKLFQLAEVLHTTAKWLATGQDMNAMGVANHLPDVVIVPSYDLDEFTEHGKPLPGAPIPLQREWLIAAAKTTTNLWVSRMPSDAMPDVAKEGDTIVLRDATPPLQDGRVYAFLLDGRPIIRRLQIRPKGLLLTASNPHIEPLELHGEDVDRLAAIARVVAAVSLNQV